MIKTAAELLQVAALRTRTVQVRDAEVRIRELSVRARLEFIEKRKASGIEALTSLVVNSLIDDDGKPLVSEEQATALAETSPEVVDAIVNAILEFSGLKDAEKKD